MLRGILNSIGVTAAGAGGTGTLYIDKTDDNYGLGEGITFHADAEDNIALGESALNSTTGAAIRNIGIGTEALTAVTTGDNNIGIGFNAGLKFTTNDGNIAIGYGTLDAADLGESNNVAIGVNAMTSVNNGTSDGTVAIGYNVMSGASTATGATNVAIGSNAMAAGSCEASGTIAIGSQALYALSSGNSNTLLGIMLG